VLNQLTTASQKAFGGVDVWIQVLSTYTTSWRGGQFHSPAALLLNRRLGEPQNQSGRRGEVKNLDPEDRSRAPFAICFHAGVPLGLFFEREDGGHMFLRNVG
jgi:hypothetical protein